MREFHKTISALVAAMWALVPTVAQVRTELRLEEGWRFSRQDAPAAIRSDFDDSRWQ